MNSTARVSVVNIFDFDQTIYAGDSSLDFYLYSVRTQPALLRYLPGQARHFLLYALKIEPKTTFKSNFFVFLRGVKNVESGVDQFWKVHDRKLKRWYLAKDHETDVIISASPEFLLRPIFQRLEAFQLIATSMDPATGAIKGANCHGPEKVLRFRSLFPDAIVSEAYSDHRSDLPILELAKTSYIVIGDHILPMEQHRMISKWKMFLMRLGQ
jgi:phosphoserine phosphatase